MGGDETDYSSFEYQQASVSAAMTPTTTSTNPNVRYLTELDVLGDIGGLANNEVAELVYHEVQVTIEPEPEALPDVDQTVSTAVEHRGILGANIGSGDGLDQFANRVDGEATSTTGGPKADVFAESASEDRVFQLYSASAIPPFDQAADAGTNTIAGGGSLDSGQVYEKHWRRLTNRGPVLDSTDDICVSGNLIASDLVDQVIGGVRLHLVWDVAETSDAGRAFSVPMDD